MDYDYIHRWWVTGERRLEQADVRHDRLNTGIDQLDIERVYRYINGKFEIWHRKSQQIKGVWYAAVYMVAIPTGRSIGEFAEYDVIEAVAMGHSHRIVFDELSRRYGKLYK